LRPGDRFNTTYFCDAIIAKLVQALYPGWAIARRRKILMHLDNARHYNFAEASEFIDGEKFMRLQHMSYSPDLVPFDFDLVRMLQEKLKNCAARTFHPLKQEVYSILKSIPEAELISVFQRWLRRFQQVTDSGGEHI
jgi:hypothetical protein